MLGWCQTEVISRGVVVTIAIGLVNYPFILPFSFKVLVGIGMCLDGLTRRFSWKGVGLGQSCSLAMVSWAVVCRPIKRGQSGVLNVQSMSTVLLTS